MSASREKKLRRELREAEENGDTVKKVKKQRTPMSAAKAKKLRSAIGTTVVVVLIVLFALLIFVNSGVLQKNATAVTVGSYKLSPVEFNYFYQDTYNNLKNSYQSYGYWDYVVDTSKPVTDQEYDDEQTWGEYIRATALDSAEQVYALYDAAQADGFTLDEDEQEEIAGIPAQIEDTAKQNDYHDADEFLSEYYGKGATVESYVEYITRQEIASHYRTEKTDSFTYSDGELSAYYEAHKQDFDTVTYRVFDVSSGDGDKDTADAMAAELDGTEQSFIDAAYKYAPEDSKESYEDGSYTLRSNHGYSSVSTDYADWLFADARVEGESQVFATESGYSVVMFVSREDNHYRTVDARHILIQVDGEDATDEDWEAAEDKINEILEEWEASDMTEDTFAELAEEYSDDTGSSSNGGLYEDIYKGQMVSEFNDWIFDDSRQVGDYEVVRTEYGYHLIYFSGYGDEYWKDAVESAKRTEDYDAWYEAYSAAYEAETSSFGLLFANTTLD